MLDPANFGTPLTMLQIPAKSIQRVQEKLGADADCAVTYYAQDCRHFSDLRKAVSADDWSLARRASVDVGYICRRCHIVYPGRAACLAHQDGGAAGRGRGGGGGAIVKLEQLQYECAACRCRTSTIVEFKSHCAGEGHRKAAAAVLARAGPAAASAASTAHRAETPHVAAAAAAAPPSSGTASNPDTKPEPTLGAEDPTASDPPAV